MRRLSPLVHSVSSAQAASRDRTSGIDSGFYSWPYRWGHVAGHFEPALDDRGGLLRQLVLRELGRLGEHGLGHIRSGLQLSANRPAQIVDEHEVIKDAALLVSRDPIEYFNHRTDLDGEAGFLGHLPSDTRFERLAGLDRAAGNAPLPGQRLEAALHQHHAALVHDDRADADMRTIGIRAVAHSPITLTTTRFLRWPSNSA